MSRPVSASPSLPVEFAPLASGGVHMDEGFEFPFYRTRAEWEEAERRRKEFDEEFNRKWAAEHRAFGEDINQQR